MSENYMVIGHFTFVDDTKAAILKLKDRGLSKFRVYSPFPEHDLEEEVYRDKRRSPVRMFCLLGGTLGCALAFLMTIWMSLDYPLRTSAKSIISIPAFVVIAFECTILLGAIITLISMFHFSRIPSIFHDPAYRPDFSKDTFGLAVRVTEDEAEEIKKDFSGCGANQVEVEYVR